MDDNNRTILHTCSTYEDYSVIKYLLTFHSSLINLVDKENHTALSLSLSKEKYLSVRYLMKHDANLQIGGG